MSKKSRRNAGVNFRKGLYCVTVGFLMVLAAGCSPISKGNMEYVEKYVNENAGYKIDEVSFNVHEKPAGISVKSSDTNVPVDEFAEFAEQSIKAVNEAVNEKNIPFRFMVAVITDTDGDVVISWHSEDGKKGFYWDRRDGEMTLNDVPISGIRAAVDSALEEIASNVTDMAYTLKMPFGDREGLFTGKLKDGVPDGEGTFTSKTESGISWTYEGEFKDGHFEGYGVTEWDNGQRKEGTHKGDLIIEGKYYFNDEFLYEGAFVDNGAIPEPMGSYVAGVMNFRTGNLEAAKEYFEKSGEYEGTKEYLDKVNLLLPYQGC